MSRLRKARPGRNAASEHGYTVIYEPLVEGGFQIIVPALPGVITYGRTMEEAREMARDAIVCHLRALVRDGDEIPRDSYASRQPIIEELKVTV
jgi:predicted RNase H-like HicB family nuclease